MESSYIHYPRFIVMEERGVILPKIYLPQNFKEIIPEFRHQQKLLVIEEYRKKLEDTLDKTPLHSNVSLRWDSELGLTHLDVFPSGGLVLTETAGIPHFQECGLRTRTGFIAGAVAMEYVYELLKIGKKIFYY